MRMRLRPKTTPLILSLLSTLAGMALSQNALSIENKSITVSHCRRLNLQNIFFYNQLLAEQVGNASAIDKIIILPSYCKDLLPKGVSLSLTQLSSDRSRMARYEAEIRIYADAFSSIEASDSGMQRNMILGFLVFNVLALALQAIHLFEDSKELEDDLR